MINLFLVLIVLLCAGANAQDTVKQYYPNGLLREMHLLDSGVREGISLLFYEQGGKKSEIPYSAGKIEGMVKNYHPNGALKELINFENGKREGACSRFDTLGKFIEELYFVNGMVQADTSADLIAYRAEQDATFNTLLQTDTSFYSFADIEPEPIGGWLAFTGRLVIPDSMKKSGLLTLYLFITSSGQVVSTELLSGISDPQDNLIITALRKTLFTSPLLNGEKIKYKMKAEIRITKN